ncbi:MAG TPA: GYD domain-containing protein [candidate division Zixibacteria bacterium]|nr:GYD domain-containing protein [candidate division Zixibacteria bacterium]
MKTFVMMTKIAPHDADIIDITNKMKRHTRNSPARIEEIQRKCPEVKFLAHFALLGPYDFMDVYEAPDERTAAAVSLLSRAYGAFQIESWTAIPCKDIADVVPGFCPEDVEEPLDITAD